MRDRLILWRMIQGRNAELASNGATFLDLVNWDWEYVQKTKLAIDDRVLLEE